MDENFTEKDVIALHEAIKKIDIVAANNFLKVTRNFSHYLLGSFVWEYTPQGHEYWRKIYIQLPPKFRDEGSHIRFKTYGIDEVDADFLKPTLEKNNA